MSSKSILRDLANEDVGKREDTQCRMSDAEIMTVVLVAALHFRGNFALAALLAGALSQSGGDSGQFARKTPAQIHSCSNRFGL
jgi:hypothetical protein